jgi:hydrogenase maturation protease
VIEPEMPDDICGAGSALDAHSMNPMKVLQSVRAMGGTPGRILLVGCEPTPLTDGEEMQMQLSPAVAAAIEPAADMIERLVRENLTHQVALEVEHEANTVGLPA